MTGEVTYKDTNRTDQMSNARYSSSVCVIPGTKLKAVPDGQAFQVLGDKTDHTYRQIQTGQFQCHITCQMQIDVTAVVDRSISLAGRALELLN